MSLSVASPTEPQKLIEAAVTPVIGEWLGPDQTDFAKTHLIGQQAECIAIVSFDESHVPPQHSSMHVSEKQPDQREQSLIAALLSDELHALLSGANYGGGMLRKIHEALIAEGHISPLNEFYRSTVDAVRVIVEHCPTYEDLVRWSLALFQSIEQTHLIAFAHDLYTIAVNLDIRTNESIDLIRCSNDLQEQVKNRLQTLTEHDLRGASIMPCLLVWDDGVSFVQKSMASSMLINQARRKNSISQTKIQ
jgi:hypothetical protein